MPLSTLIRRVLPVAVLGVVAACARDAVGPHPGGNYRAMLQLVPVFPSVRSATGVDTVGIDSVVVTITNAKGDTLGLKGVAFPPGQNSVALSIPVLLDSATQTVTARVDILANGQVIFRLQAQVVASVGSSATPHADSIALESAIWTVFQATSQAALPGRIGFTAVYDTGAKEIVGFGGATASGFTGQTWALKNGQWLQVTTASAPSARVGQGMVFDAGRARTVLFGGAAASGFTNETWEFNAATQQWSPITATGSPSARGLFSFAYDPARGVIVLFGGHDGANFLNETWEYNGAARTWTRVTTASAPAPRAGPVMVYDAAIGKIVLFGGLNANVNALNDTWTYNGTTWTQVCSACSPKVRAAHGMAYDSAGARVLLFGGANAHVDLSNPTPSVDTLRHNDLWAFNGTTWTQLLADGAAGSPSKRAAMAVVFRGGKLVVISGLSATAIESDTWEWNGTKWSQTAWAPLVPRSQHALAYDARRGVTIMFGGTGADSVTWLFDGTAWRSAALFGGPGARVAPAMAYDSSRALMVLFGGSKGGAPQADTWVYDGTTSTWTNPATTGSPAARSGAAMAYDSRRGTIVMFGGQGASGALGDTWEYNGTTRTWTQVSVAGAPSARSGAAMAFDPVRGKVVLFGGGNLADTWTYNGTAWTQVTTLHAPSARSGAAMAFQISRRKSILFGGTASGGRQGDIWAFDGTDWVQLYPVVSPSARTAAAMVYDAARGYVLLFGGSAASGDLADTWLFR